MTRSARSDTKACASSPMRSSGAGRPSDCRIGRSATARIGGLRPGPLVERAEFATSGCCSRASKVSQMENARVSGPNQDGCSSPPPARGRTRHTRPPAWRGRHAHRAAGKNFAAHSPSVPCHKLLAAGASAVAVPTCARQVPAGCAWPARRAAHQRRERRFEARHQLARRLHVDRCRRCTARCRWRPKATSPSTLSSAAAMLASRPK
jgi:hypothetical protein